MRAEEGGRRGSTAARTALRMATPAAHDECVTPHPMLFLMVGLPGAGKTTRARDIEHHHRALRLTPDEWMIPLFGDSDAAGKRDVLEGRLIWVALRVLSAGANVVLDFGFWGRDERSALRSLAHSAGADCTVIYLAVDEVIQHQRISERYDQTAEHTFVVTAAELALYRTQFEVPDDREIAGASMDPPPADWASWSAWASDRWPSLPLV